MSPRTVRGPGGLRRASDSLRRVVRDISAGAEAIEPAWASAVGAAVWRRTRLAGIGAGVLVVEVPDDVWRAAVQGMSSRILEALRSILGPRAPRALEVVTVDDFEATVPRSRRSPSSSSSAEPCTATSDDELFIHVEDPDVRAALIRAHRSFERGPKSKG